ncbi:unnamed protein product [Ranitomeya imitator]|uniref:ribonuclease H n=1 Tax=Ranitomeya imitator TaxID=111125 RepID=A0ABN9MR06_9NEOB|nr:unnamed protein product [Ranitomeya imitator]
MLKTKHKAQRPTNKQQLKSVAVFGANVTSAVISNGVLTVMHSPGLVRLYSFERILKEVSELPCMQQECVIGETCNWKGETGTVGDFPFGIPCNITLTERPPVLFEVHCLQNIFQVGGFPWHYIYTPHKKKDKGTHHICSMDDHSLAKNGIRDMKFSSIEPDSIFFHPDCSERIIHVGPDNISVLRIKEIKDSTCKYEITEDFAILADKEPKVDNLVTFTSSGRMVKKRYKKLDDDHEEVFSDVIYEDDLDLLTVVAVTNRNEDGVAHLNLHCNETGRLLKKIKLADFWDMTDSHSLVLDLDTVIHIEERPNRNFSCQFEGHSIIFYFKRPQKNLSCFVLGLVLLVLSWTNSLRTLLGAQAPFFPRPSFVAPLLDVNFGLFGLFVASRHQSPSPSSNRGHRHVKRRRRYPLGPLLPGVLATPRVGPPGLEEPPRPDSRPVDNPPPRLGGRLLFFRDVWISSVEDAWVRDVVSSGYKLENAYLHVPIFPGHHRSLCFAVLQEHFQFVALPFGLATAPRVFTKIMAALMAILRVRSLVLFPYLDDLLIKAPCFSQAHESLSIVLDTLVRFGWRVNRKKSCLIPSRRIIFLGMRFDTRQTKIFPKTRSIHRRDIRVLQGPRYPSFRSAMKVLGKMLATLEAIPFAQFHSRPLQQAILSQWNRSIFSLDRPIRLSPQAKQSLNWWLTSPLVSQGRSFLPVPWQVVMTDASLLDWGAVFRHLTVQSRWSTQEATLSINVLVIRAILCPFVSGKGFSGVFQSESRRTIVMAGNQATQRAVISAHTEIWQ